MPNKTVKTLTVDNVTYDIKDELARNNIVSTNARVSTIESYIPNNTSTTNKLVNSSSVHNSTITIKQGGEERGSFTLNQATGAEIELTGGSGGTGATFLFEKKELDYAIEDDCWKRTDLFQWIDGYHYTTAYEHLTADLATATEHVDWWESNITKVGDLVDNEGVLSGFTGKTIYAQFPNASEIPAVTSSFELVVKVHTPATFSAVSNIFQDTTQYKGFILQTAKTSGNLIFYASSNGTSWNIANNKATGITLSPDTDYYIKLAWDGAEYVVSYSTDGEEYTDGTPIANVNPIKIDWTLQGFGGTSRNSEPWLSTIDLNESYIKVDGEEVWHGCEYFTYSIATDGHRITSETEAIKYFNRYNSAWFYVVDTTSHQFKLPRTIYGFNGYRNEVGGFIEAGVPNIEGFVGRVWSGGSTGAFYADSTTNSSAWGYNGVRPQVWFDASRSNKVYGNSNTVQPPATQMYIYMYVGEYV